MTEYVVGFLFDKNLEKVVLIRKLKPEWQKGKLNGVGGKVEPGEVPRDAMVREFEEETGAAVKVWDWKHFGTLLVDSHQGECQVHFYAAHGYFSIRSVTDEPVAWYPVKEAMLGNYGVIPNLRWLLPLARQKFDAPAWHEDGVFTLV